MHLQAQPRSFADFHPSTGASKTVPVSTDLRSAGVKDIFLRALGVADVEGLFAELLSAYAATMESICCDWPESSSAALADSSEFAAVCCVTEFICSIATLICSTPRFCCSLAAAVPSVR